METTFVELLRNCLKESHDTLEATMADVTEDVAHFAPGGKALPIAAAYAHILVSEDMLLSGMVTKKPALLDGEWKDKLGLSEPHPAMDNDWEKNFSAWSTTVKADMAQLKEYGQAVFKQTDDFLAPLKDADLIAMKADLSQWEMGEWDLAKFVIRMMIGHVDSVLGEISAVKGLQNMKGYPF